MGNLLRIVAGLAGLAGAGWSALWTLRLRRQGREADAVVVGSPSGAQHAAAGRPRRSRARFRDDDGVEHVARLPGRHEAGETVTVRYVPGRTGRVAAGAPSFVPALAILAAAAVAIALTLLL